MRTKVAVKGPRNEIFSTQNHKNNLTRSLSLQELQEVRNMSSKLRRVKRQMLLKYVDDSKDPPPINSFRSFIINLVVEEAKEALRMRSNSISSEGTLSGSSSFDYSAQPSMILPLPCETSTGLKSREARIKSCDATSR
jgi:hypothetical protein